VASNRIFFPLVKCFLENEDIPCFIEHFFVFLLEVNDMFFHVFLLQNVLATMACKSEDIITYSIYLLLYNSCSR